MCRSQNWSCLCGNMLRWIFSCFGLRALPQNMQKHTCMQAHTYTHIDICNMNNLCAFVSYLSSFNIASVISFFLKCLLSPWVTCSTLRSLRILREQYPLKHKKTFTAFLKYTYLTMKQNRPRGKESTEV